jgi:hypothetical protein
MNWALIGLLSLSSGYTKVTTCEMDLKIFAAIGFGLCPTMIVGAWQLLASVLWWIPKTHRWGATLLVPTFILGTVGLFAVGKTAFGAVSILFILMALVPWLVKKGYPIGGS